MSAAETLFAAQGVDAVSIDEIASRADVAKGTFYNYFTDKDTLAREVSEATRLELDGAIGQLNEGIDDPAMRVARAACCVLRFALANPDRARAMTRMHPNATDPEAPINAGLRADMRLGLRAGRFAVPSDAAGMILVVGVVSAGLARALDLREAAAVRQLARELGTLMLRGLGLPPPDSETVMTEAAAAVFDRIEAS
jgi:AcrR family transcriptional regulator